MNDRVVKKKNGWRGSEELWLDAAYEILIESGVEAVKVMPLAKALDMSRTSFYWHFEDRDMLLEAIINRWEKKNTRNLVQRTEAYADTITEAMFNLFDCWLDSELFDSRLDLAIRNWARNDKKLKKRLDKADATRVAAVEAVFLRFGYSKIQAETRSHAIIYTQVGYISMMVSESLDHRVLKMPTYIEFYTGHVPHDPEIKRFLARHNLAHLQMVKQ